MLQIIKYFVVLFAFWGQNASFAEAQVNPSQATVVVGAARFEAYLPLLAEKKVGLVVNHTSLVGSTHLLDTLLSRGVKVMKIFAPEHGFRGEADAGEKVKDGPDQRTGVPIVSLYGAKRKPGPADFAGLDQVVFDIQDVGVRYYTYLSTLHNVMEACAEQGLPLVVLDRPNPNGHYVDGNILDLAYRSFVGMHPVPIVHGLTVGEYAQMINGEGWLAGGIRCNLQVIPCAGYTHATHYDLPVKPSPNLPNMRAIYLYPGICLFEGTVASVGRGTDKQFQVYGAPGSTFGDYLFTPQPKPGAMQPFQQGKECRGFDLTGLSDEQIRRERRINLEYLIDFYQRYPQKEAFFLPNLFIDKLAGGATLRQQITAGLSADAIRATWQEGLAKFRQQRKPYLLYPE